MSRLLQLVTIVFIALIILPGCRLMKVMKRPIRKHITADTTALKPKLPDTVAAKKITVAVDTSSIVEKRLLVQNLTALWNRQLQFKTLSAKVKIHYEGPDQNVDFIAHIHIRKDSVIWINISGSILGLQAQVGRALITHDSLKWINHLQKEVTLLPLSEASKLLPAPIDFSTLQNFIIGDALHKSGNITDATVLPNAWAIQVEDDSLLQRVTYNKSDSTIANAQMAMRTNFSLHGITQFTNYLPVSGNKFSFNRECNIQNAGKQYYLAIYFQTVDFDTEPDFYFNIPKNFSLVTY